MEDPWCILIAVRWIIKVYQTLKYATFYDACSTGPARAPLPIIVRYTK